MSFGKILGAMSPLYDLSTGGQGGAMAGAGMALGVPMMGQAGGMLGVGQQQNSQQSEEEIQKKRLKMMSEILMRGGV